MCTGEANITYERYVFHQRVQQPGQSFDYFLSDIRKMARTCDFGQLEDSLVRDPVVIGIRDETSLIIADDNNDRQSSSTRLVLQDLLVPADVLIADTTGHCWAVSVVCCVDTWLIA